MFRRIRTIGVQKSQQVTACLAEAGFAIANIDATIVAEQPRLGEYIGGMRQMLSRTLGINVNQVSIKASTANHVGSLGRGEGMAAYAVALIEGGKDEDI